MTKHLSLIVACCAVALAINAGVAKAQGPTLDQRGLARHLTHGSGAERSDALAYVKSMDVSSSRPELRDALIAVLEREGAAFAALRRGVSRGPEDGEFTFEIGRRPVWTDSVD